MTKIELLKSFAKSWFGNSQQHSIHAQLLKERGLNKLAEMIMAESDEEWEEAKNERFNQQTGGYRCLSNVPRV